VVGLYFENIQINGEHLTFWYLGKYYRYPLVMPKVSRKGLPMQDSVGGDNNRTPVKFQVPDVYRIVGAINGPGQKTATTIYSINLRMNICGIVMIFFGFSAAKLTEQ
jgi:hypothetical protein